MKKICLLVLALMVVTIINGCATVGQENVGKPVTHEGHQGHRH